MAVPAFDMEPGSTSVPPDGTVEPPSSEAVPQPLASGEGAPAKVSSAEPAQPKPPAASLVSITTKSKPVGPAKTGDLTRLFELARKRALVSEAAVEVPPAVIAAALELQPSVSTPTETIEPSIVFEAAPEMPELLSPSHAAEAPDAGIETKPADEPKTAPEATSLWETPEPSATALAPTEDPPAAGATGEAPHEEPPSAAIEMAALPAPEPPPAFEPAPSVAFDTVQPVPVPRLPVALPTPKFTELADYWRSLCRGDDHPAAEAIDRDLVTERWPGSLLIAYTPASQDPRGEPRPGRVTRLGTACKETQSAVDTGSHSTEWMLEVARAALVNDEPVEEQQRLATLTGVAGFRMVALPLGPPRALPNAVLCTLVPAPTAPRFGKRRTWLSPS
jgi:hypothetical protein